MRRAVRGGLLSFLLLALAACGPVPHPFQPERGGAPNPLLAPPDDAIAIHVRPIQGLPDEDGTVLAEELAAALRKAEVPAATAGGNRVLEGRASVAAASGDRIRVALVWTLSSSPLGTSSPAGAARGFEQSFETARRDWSEGGLLPRVLEEAVPRIAEMARGERPVAVPAAVEPAGPVVRVPDVVGAPGDGATALARAMRGVLRRAGVALASDPQGSTGSFILTGRVAVSRPRDGAQAVEIVWVLADPEGAELGRVAQANTIPAGLLDARWGDVAWAAASGAAEGVLDLLARVEREGRRAR